jgi:hypothetical protein
LTLHRNKWHCDCYLLELHNWLQNFTVPYLVEPKCHSPERLIGRDIKTTDDQVRSHDGLYKSFKVTSSLKFQEV